MNRTWLVAALALSSSVASADTIEPRNEFLPLSFGLPQVGLGMVTRSDTAMDVDKRGFDGTLRYSGGWHTTARLQLGAFVEARTASFDTFELAFGPQTQYSLSAWWGMQLRSGLGIVAGGNGYAIAGVHFGNAICGLTVTGRRFFDDQHYELSVNVELTTALLLFPYLRSRFGDSK